MSAKSIKLRCCEPATNTDKDYVISIIPQGELWGVEIQYGRHGQVLRPSMKTNAPVALAVAEKTFDKVLNGQLAKGYVVEGQTAEAVAAPERISSGIHCQLLNPVVMDDAERFITDDEWLAEQKHDGDRLLIKKQAREVTAINRRGLVVPGPQHLIDCLAKFDDDFTIDGEWVGRAGPNGTYYVWDCLSLNGSDLRGIGYAFRSAIVFQQIAKPDDVMGMPIQAVVQASYADSKRALLEKVRSEGGEGIVFKRHDAAYKAGKNHADQVKLKFWFSCSAIVGAINDKRSVALHLVEDAGRPTVVSVGNVTIPSNQDIPAIGDIVEVRYLYAYRGGSLFQPAYLGKRTDISTAECVTSQLAYKEEAREELTAEQPAMSFR